MTEVGRGLTLSPVPNGPWVMAPSADPARRAAYQRLTGHPLEVDPRSVEGRCGRCGHPVLIGPGSWEHVRRRLAFPICEGCLLEPMLALGWRPEPVGNLEGRRG